MPAQLKLAQVRERAGLTLETIAEQTKISIRFLRAIEKSDYAQLPGGIFDTSYIRQYAAAVGIPPEPLLDHYFAVTAPHSEGADTRTLLQKLYQALVSRERQTETARLR